MLNIIFKDKYYFILKDENTNKNVYIPHYEVARWFYFTTPSMTKQILSASLKEESSMLKGLYKNIKHAKIDRNKNGIPDAMMKDVDNNGIWDIIAYDTDEDGSYERVTSFR